MIKTKLLTTALFVGLAALLYGCGTSVTPTPNEPPETPPEGVVVACWQSTSSETPSANLLSFPTIYGGEAFVGGREIEDGFFVVACLQNAGTGGYSDMTSSGRYENLVLGTQYVSEIEGKVNFVLARELGEGCVLNESGNCVVAEQELVFQTSTDFNYVSVNLNFPGIPDLLDG